MSVFRRFIISAALVTRALAGPFPPSAGSSGSDAVAAGDPRFSLWASAAAVTRGPVEIEFPDESLANYGSEAAAVGPADATPDQPYPVVSLGDGGRIELNFPNPFGDVPGPDFAVFENSFAPIFLELAFLELAHVEVSSDGIHFYRFPSVSLTPLSSTAAEGSSVDPTNVRNLAGKYIAGFGTPFDLAELKALYPALDIQRITQVRVIDVVGTNVPQLASLDSVGHIIADPYPTPFPSSGFDLDAVGAFNATTTHFASWTASQGFTNPTATADSDQNGVPNLIEYLTGNGTLAVTAAASGTTLHFSRLAYRSGGDLKIEASPDLRQWTTLAQSLNGAAVQATHPAAASISESGDFRKEVTLGLPAPSIYRYFRLSAVLAP
jgi:hypothetical protein